MGRRRDKKRQSGLEALPDIVECGGELIWVMGFTPGGTPGGAPYGLTELECAANPELLAVFEEWKDRNCGDPRPNAIVDLDVNEPPF